MRPSLAMKTLAAVVGACALWMSAPAYGNWNDAAFPIDNLIAHTRTVFGPCPSESREIGCVFRTGLGTPPTVYVDVAYFADEPGPWAADLYWHELGHAFDTGFLFDRDRTYLLHVMGLSGRPWMDDREPKPREEFAAAFALCARWGLRPPVDATPGAHWRVLGSDGWQPTLRRQRRMCAVIEWLVANRVPPA
jgi:hypothetical protein